MGGRLLHVLCTQGHQFRGRLSSGGYLQARLVGVTLGHKDYVFGGFL